ncbi:MAG: hypothetical protein LBV68_02095 [Spirochaetaceae bacterium]|jgi:hypothetical protein|nr:hypothetical protein [Spirochaetaceae bacterium]
MAAFFDSSKNWYIVTPESDGIKSIEELSRVISLLREKAGLAKIAPPIISAKNASPPESAEIIINYTAGSPGMSFAWRAGEERIEIYAHSLQSLDNAIADFLKALGINRAPPETLALPSPAQGALYLISKKAEHVF